ELSAGHELPDPWKGPEQCHAGFCLFSNSEAGGGLSLITTPRIAHLIATSKEIPESTGIEPEAFYEAEVPGKGSGLIANRTIHKGEVIMQRGPALLIQSVPHIDLEPGRRLELYQAAVDRLPEPMRSRFLRQAGDTVYDKVEKNSFRVFLDGDRKHSIHLGLFPDMSKFNHDCRPNVHYRISDLTHTTVAVRDIPAGEELTISYIYGLKARAERLEQLSEWGFTCTCPQCALSEPEAGASDNRIRQIKMLEDEIEELIRRLRPAAVLRPELGARLVELYREERLDAYMAPALTRAALLYSMFGHEERAREYAREAVGALEREKGPRAGDL
ncbi:SET domain-containing protein, partial [Thermothelomyces heterothallicus CBS 203.75]